MTLKDKLETAWKNRSQIIDGLYHTFISCSPELEQEAQRRLSICKENTCGYWDESGQSDKLVIKGKSGCTACGCEGNYKVHCFSCDCSLKQLGLPPLWEAVITEEQDKEIKQKQYEKQFKK